MNNATKSIGLKISKLAAFMNKKQTVLVEDTGISAVAINKFFKGHSDLNLYNFVLLLKELDIDLNKIISQKISTLHDEPNSNRIEDVKDVIHYLFNNLDSINQQTHLKHMAWINTLAGKNKTLPKEVNKILEKEINLI